MDADNLRPICIADRKEWSRLVRSHRRPLLVHLNADTSWLIQIPYPSTPRPPTGRSHFNILLDPWLQGPQSDVASWFSTQWHVVPPSVDTISDLEAALREVEDGGNAETCGSYVDAVVISHEFTDHCHKATLEQLSKDTQVFAPEAAANLIQGWGHFTSVTITPVFQPDKRWTHLTSSCLPEWLGIGRVTSPGNALYYHSAIVIVYDVDHAKKTEDSVAETIIYSPHGINPQDLYCLKTSELRTLALLHGLHDVRLWLMKQLNLGALNGIRAVDASGAKYWIATHDEEKTGRGFVSPFLWRKKYTLKEAVTYAEAQLQNKPDYTFMELGSGEALLLN